MEEPDLRDLREHCSELSYFFASEYWEHAAEWLGMASGVIKVEFCKTRHFPYLGWCAAADEHDHERDQLLSQLATELAVFSFIWGSFESLTEHIVPAQYYSLGKQRLGKIGATCNFLKNNFEPEPLLLIYEDLLAQLRTLLIESEHYNNLKDEFNLRPHVGKSGIGLHVVYKIRNAFAHGSLVIPEHSEDEQPIDPQLINVSSRIVLLSIQMLAQAYYKEDNHEIDYWWNKSGEASEIDVKVYLRTAHIDEDEEDLNQRVFDFGIAK